MPLRYSPYLLASPISCCCSSAFSLTNTSGVGARGGVVALHARRETGCRSLLSLATPTAAASRYLFPLRFSVSSTYICLLRSHPPHVRSFRPRHTLTSLSTPPLAKRAPPRWIASEETKWPCAFSSVVRHRPLCVMSHTRSDRSSDALTMNCPPGWKSARRTQLSCPRSVETHSPVATDQTRTVLSRDAETT